MITPGNVFENLLVNDEYSDVKNMVFLIVHLENALMHNSVSCKCFIPQTVSATLSLSGWCFLNAQLWPRDTSLSHLRIQTCAHNKFRNNAKARLCTCF